VNNLGIHSDTFQPNLQDISARGFLDDSLSESSSSCNSAFFPYVPHEVDSAAVPEDCSQDSISGVVTEVACAEVNTNLIEEANEDDSTLQSNWSGFKIVADNIDKNIKPRYYRSDTKVNALHYCHCYGLKDRIDITGMSDRMPKIALHSVNYDILFPSNSDDVSILKNMSTLVARVLTQHIPFFKLKFEDVVIHHIKHDYYKEMSSKSQCVSLSILSI
jgi:hypothetical protein